MLAEDRDLLVKIFSMSTLFVIIFTLFLTLFLFSLDGISSYLRGGKKIMIDSRIFRCWDAEGIWSREDRYIEYEIDGVRVLCRLDE